MSGTIDELRTIILTDTHPVPRRGCHFHQYRYRLSIPLTGREAPSAQPNHSGRSPARWVWLNRKSVEPYRGPYGCSPGKI